MIQNFLAALQFVWRPDFDGQPYHVTEHDTGKGTAWGVTEETWQEALDNAQRYQLMLSTTKLQYATKSDCAQILERMFYMACGAQLLNPGVDLVAFDMAMAAGNGRENHILQRAVGVEEDGIVGSVTISAANRMAPRQLIDLLTCRDEQFFAGLTTFKYFGRGWDRRADECRLAALALLDKPKPRMYVGQSTLGGAAYRP
jgi:lysozyme family protein